MTRIAVDWMYEDCGDGRIRGILQDTDGKTVREEYHWKWSHVRRLLEKRGIVAPANEYEGWTIDTGNGLVELSTFGSDVFYVEYCGMGIDWDE